MAVDDTHFDEGHAMTYPNTQLFINGQWRDATDGRTLAVFNPSTGAVARQVLLASTDDVAAAVAAAKAAQPAWGDTPPYFEAVQSFPNEV